MTRLALEFVRVMRQSNLDREAAVRVRVRRFRRFVAEAIQTSPFHRERCLKAGFEPRELREPEALSALPFMERTDLSERLDAIASTAVPAAKRRELRTSGSSGVPLKVWVSHREEAVRQALQLRARWLAGRRPLQREAVIGTYGGGARPRSPGRFGRSLYLSALDPAADIATALRAFDPDYVVALPSTLVELGEDPGIRPKLITTGAEVLEPDVRRLLEARFGAPVRDIYGAIETGLLAFQCRAAEGYHLNADEIYFEFLPVHGDSEGMCEVVVTPLFARATPLVRYRLGDLVRTLPGACACGSWLPRIAVIEGRRDDWCIRPDGRLVAPASIRALFRRGEPFMHYRVTQHSHGAVHLELAGPPGCEARVTALTNGLAELVGRPVEVDVLSDLPRDPSGKRRAIRRLVDEVAA